MARTRSTPRGTFVGKGDIAVQTEQVLRNLRTALDAAGARPEHVVKWNVPIVDGQDFATGYAAFQGLAHPDFLVEMDAIAIVPA